MMMLQPCGLKPTEVRANMMYPVVEQGVHARLPLERLSGRGIDMRKGFVLQ